MEDFVTLSKLGEGAFGEVFRARHLPTGKTVALKHVRVRRLDDGLPRSVLREIKALEQLEHPRVVRLLEWFPHGSTVVLVLEYMETDLQKLMWSLADVGRQLHEQEIKTLLRQLLEGAAALHDARVIHRDIKPSNLLLAPDGSLKLGDFGLARVLRAESHGPRDQSHEVATRWYRAPELLFGARVYGEAVDVWAIGCVFAEMLNGCPLFPGENDIDQLYRVLRGTGTPTDETWPEVRLLPDFGKITFPDSPPTPFEELLPDASPAARALAARLLVCSPLRRATAREALDDPYFFTEPLPLAPGRLRGLAHLPQRQMQLHAAAYSSQVDNAEGGGAPPLA